MSKLRTWSRPCVVAACLLLSLCGGVALKGECFGAHQADWRSRLCYTDIQALYDDAGHGIKQGQFPYVDARLVGRHGSHGFNEYPVLTGVFMWAMGRLSLSVSSYLAVTMAALSICAVVSAVLLWRLVDRRAIWFAAPPILLLYAYHNWDLLAVMASVAGLYQWTRGRSRWAVVAFAVGGAFKLYPALFILPLGLDAYRRHGVRQAAKLVGLGAGVLVAINLPFVLANADGWAATYRFQLARSAAIKGPVWSALHAAFGTPTNAWFGSSVGFLALLAVTLCLLRTGRRSQGYPVTEWCAAATALVVSLNKVNSPQYIIWMLPFLALISASPVWWWALSTVATARYVGTFGVDVFPLGLQSGDHLVHVAILLQAALLVAYAARTSARHPTNAPRRTSHQPRGALNAIRTMAPSWRRRLQI